MKIKGRSGHFNISVTDLKRSIVSYKKAPGLKEHHREEAVDGPFILAYSINNITGFLLELTWLRDRTETYELGRNESHLYFHITRDHDAIRQYHKEMNCVCSENTATGLYFVGNPDDYWIEVLPGRF